MTDWQPLNDNVLLEQTGKLPELLKCKVIAVGPGMRTLGGILKPAVKVGDVVLVRRSDVISVFKGKKPLFIAHEHRLRIKCGQKELL